MDPKLIAVRAALQQHGLGAVIVPSQDPHQSEYVADHWNAREWISGFTGSAGTAVVTTAEAGLWTDSRYFLQAERELAGSEVTFHKQVVPGAPEHLEWLSKQLKAGDRVAIDGALLSQDGLDAIHAELSAAGLVVVTDHDVIGAAWAAVGGRPALPATPVYDHPQELAGATRAQKLADMRKLMRLQQADHLLLVALDDIAWAFNLRGQDVDCNPVFYAYALVGLKDATLYIAPEKLPADLAATLAAEGIAVAPYGGIREALGALTGRLMVDGSQLSLALQSALGPDFGVVKAQTPATSLKARKNPIEVGHLRRTMEKDGVALLRTLRWLEQALARGERPREHDLSVELRRQRAAQAMYRCESFDAIVGFGPNAAIVHYRPSETDSAYIAPDGLLLLDSGGQYLDGTTDITRTLALGNAPEAAKLPYTLVLKGHIALATAKFPAGTPGFSLDPLARQFLWQEGLNYGHGTGHGVGFFLCVHEGPQGISSAYGGRSKVALQPGMVVSNEPGYYEDGHWGIRIENLILCVEGPQTGSGRFLAFETLSLFPIDHRLIVWERLTKAELRWLRAYHETVLERLSPHLNADEKDWLAAACAPYFA